MADDIGSSSTSSIGTYDTNGGTNQENHDNVNTDQDQDTGFILVEIVSALNVPNVDHLKEPDPYVVVSMGGEEKIIHQTEVLWNTEFPIWSLESGSHFLVPIAGPAGRPGDNNTTTAEEQDAPPAKDAPVHFKLMEYEGFRADPVLGTLDISMKVLLEGKGKRREFPFVVPQHIEEITQSVHKTIVRKTRLVLRFKPATYQDIEFIQTLESKKAGIHSKETYLPPMESAQNATNRFLGNMPTINEWGATYFGMDGKDKQYSDNQPPDALLVEALKPSKEWIEVGDPNAPGKVYVEVIACNNLPNLDAPTVMQGFANLSDPFCCLIMEDSVVNTTYINDNLNPRWMPTGDHRAFVFRVKHPSSHLYVGVFNRNSTAKIYRPLNVFREWIHTPIGRVLINPTILHPDTLYTLHHHIYEVSSDGAKDRVAGDHNGTLIIRIRIEWEHQVLDAMRLPPEFYISVPRKHDFQTATYTTVGERHSDDFSIAALTSYVEELESYYSEENLELVSVIVLIILLWRGTYKVNVFGREMLLPVNSALLFTWGVLVTQNYNRFPSFVMFSIAWVFLISAALSRRHPSPWHQCESYRDLLQGLISELLHVIIGDSSRSVLVRMKETIAANENEEEIQRYNDERQQRKKVEQSVKLKKAAELEEEVERHKAEMAVLSEANIATAKRETVNFFQAANPLKPILHPIQTVLHQLCIYMRIVKSIVSWQENYYPFWIVTFCFVISALIFFVPWGLILRWLIRILVWVFLGPWMRIVDWYYFEQVDHMTPEERETYVRRQAQSAHKAFQAQRLQRRTEREARVKLKSMMKYLFGKYVVRVPRFQQAQFLDNPLPASTAEPYRGDVGTFTTIGQVCNQTLVGDMIPSRTVQARPFTKNIKHEAPSDRTTRRFEPSAVTAIRPKSSPSPAKKKKRKRLSFSRFLKKIK
ncbi:expressed unknown protein [Seminavis robusta]|uniref:C2 domain-containing protein n=1 Tax=Seminavis robusta TaxID=568900 RepID=A0A9N8DP63_9STRA|nr:expressed unknown protein [Seminavis robusta]|eukprot:Sro240_g096090.1 n/a (929) ;mRNA; f:21994-25255